jgi:heme-degrading monooxygenase HmoA
MILAQTAFSVRSGNERRAERILAEIDRLLEQALGHCGHRLLRSSRLTVPVGAVRDEAREALLAEGHYVLQCEWESLPAHDSFYRSEALQMAYLTLSPLLSRGPYAVLYEEVVADCEHSAAGF